MWLCVLLLFVSHTWGTLVAINIDNGAVVNDTVLGNTEQPMFRNQEPDIKYFLDVIDQFKRNVENLNAKIDEMGKMISAQTQEISELKNTRIKNLENTINAQNNVIAGLSNRKFEHIRDEALTTQSEKISELENQFSLTKEHNMKEEHLNEKNSYMQNELTRDTSVQTKSTDVRKQDGIAGPHLEPMQHGVRNQRVPQGINEVAFTAYLDHELTDLNPGMIVKCNQILVNHGNGYNKFTGIFTVPIRGTYFFTFNIHSGLHKINVRLLSDGHNVVNAVVHTDPDPGPLGYRETMGSNSAVIDAEVGTSVWLETTYDHNGSLFGSEGFRYVTFTGFMLF